MYIRIASSHCMCICVSMFVMTLPPVPLNHVLIQLPLSWSGQGHHQICQMLIINLEILNSSWRRHDLVVKPWKRLDLLFLDTWFPKRLSWMWFITHSFWYNLYFLDLLSQVSYPVGNVPIHQSGMYSLDDLPKTAVRSFSQSSCVMSMDFHPVQQSVLLGTNFTISFNILSLLMLLYQCLFCILLDSWQQCWRHCHLGCWYTRSPSP